MLHLDLDLVEESLDSFLLKAVPVQEQGLITVSSTRQGLKFQSILPNRPLTR